MRRGERGEEHDMTTHLIKFKFLPTLVALSYLTRLFSRRKQRNLEFRLISLTTG